MPIAIESFMLDSTITMDELSTEVQLQLLVSSWLKVHRKRKVFDSQINFLVCTGTLALSYFKAIFINSLSNYGLKGGTLRLKVLRLNSCFVVWKFSHFVVWR